jgi:Alginate export
MSTFITANTFALSWNSKVVSILIASVDRDRSTKKLDFQVAFLEVGTGDERNWIKFRAGRHELEYGSGRLIDVREGPNVRLSFDGFKVKAGVGSWQIDGFAVRPDLDKPGFFNNAPNHAVGFWGVYGVRPLTKTITLDTYYLGLDRKTATFNRGAGHEVRHSIGARLSRPIAEKNPGWDFDYEALWQFGTFGSANIRAWTIASETGYRITTAPLKPRFSAKADISSGDDPRTNTLGHSIRYSPRATILAFSPRLAPVRSTL